MEQHVDERYIQMTIPSLHAIAALEQMVDSAATTSRQSTLADIALIVSLSLILDLGLSVVVYNRFFKHQMPRGEFRR